jgi:hypothetical protein
METILYIVVIISGLITLLGAVLNWQGMYKSRRAKSIVSFLGLTGARIFYGVLGLFIVVVGILALIGTFG